MRVETLLGVALVVVSIGNYILYTGLQSKIAKLKNDIEMIDTIGTSLMKELGEIITKCDELERRCSYLEADAKRLYFELMEEDSRWKINKKNY